MHPVTLELLVECAYNWYMVKENDMNFSDFEIDMVNAELQVLGAEVAERAVAIQYDELDELWLISMGADDRTNEHAFFTTI